MWTTSRSSVVPGLIIAIELRNTSPVLTSVPLNPTTTSPSARPAQRTGESLSGCRRAPQDPSCRGEDGMDAAG